MSRTSRKASVAEVLEIYGRAKDTLESHWKALYIVLRTGSTGLF